jgi:hypothetical protein
VVLVALIVLATIAFAIGASLEKGGHHDETTTSATASDTILIGGRSALLADESGAEQAEEGGTQAEEGGEAPPAESQGESPAKKAPESAGESRSHRAAEGGAPETAAEHADEASSEKLLGLDPESTALVIAAVAISLLLAWAVWVRPDRLPLLALVALAMLVFAALDVREALHQGDEGNTGLAILASAIAILHIAAGTLAAFLSWQGRSDRAAPHPAG